MEINKKNEISKQDTVYNAKIFQQTEAEIIMHLEHLAQIHHLILRTLKYRQVETLPAKLSITILGKPTNLMAFLAQLSAQRFLVSDFILEFIKYEKYRLTMAILMHAASNETHNNGAVSHNHPISNLFCDALEQSFLAQRDTGLLLTTPLSQFKMIGYLRLGMRHAALVMLPNRMVYLVKEHQMLGKENFKIDVIEQKQIKLRTPTNKPSSRAPQQVRGDSLGIQKDLTHSIFLLQGDEDA